MTEKNVSGFLNQLIHKNGFLKIVSVLLAILLWACILYIGNPVNKSTFDKVEVTIPYPGSVPERNGYMYLMTDTNLTVSVSVSGSRSTLFQLSQSDIRASLNMDSVVSAGTYSIPVVVSNDDPSITVTDIYPKAFTIEFATKQTKTFAVELLPTGSLPDGYSLTEQSLSPEHVTVSGPEGTVNSIRKVYVSPSLTNVRTGIDRGFDLILEDEHGENVDRKYLTVSDESIEAKLSVIYSKTLSVTAPLTNTSGGDESSYITVTLNKDTVTAIGSEKLLEDQTQLKLSGLDTSALTKSQKVKLTVPQTEGVTYDAEEFTADVRISEQVSTKTLHYTAKDLTFLNIPTGKSPTVGTVDLYIKIRALSGDLKKFTIENSTCTVNLATPNADGTYPIVVTSAAGIPYGVVGSYSVQVTM